MKCMFCANQATIFLTQVTGTELNKVSLCEPCSNDAGLLESNGLLEAFVDSLMPPAPSVPTPSPIPSSEEDLTCTCGFSVKDFSNTGRLGCSACYDTFSAFLEERINSLHTGDQHIGKVIEIPESKTSLEKQLKETILALRNAVNKEEFEEAASLKKTITSIEKKLSAL